eukprot:6067951-Ditylum_brightwellii.AAC.1
MEDVNVDNLAVVLLLFQKKFKKKFIHSRYRHVFLELLPSVLRQVLAIQGSWVQRTVWGWPSAGQDQEVRVGFSDVFLESPAHLCRDIFILKADFVKCPQERG